ncbi:MAG: thiamine phosphate synthase [Acidobacteria bacterium]|nr:thiamine phosphate synthase [Acidobacteriota bacterium]
MLVSLPPLYPITDLALARIRSHFELVLALIAGGARWIQIREKELPHQELLVQVEQAVQQTLSRRITLVINDWIEMARSTGVSGVHLGQTDFPVEEARNQLPKKIIGFSTHSLEQARAANRLPVDYISIGPIFPTRTKTEYAPLGIEVLHEVRKVVSKPLVAIGGISLTNVAQVWAAGVDSVAVISDIMGSGDITSRAASYLRLWKKLNA